LTVISIEPGLIEAPICPWRNHAASSPCHLACNPPRSAAKSPPSGD